MTVGALVNFYICLHTPYSIQHILQVTCSEAWCRHRTLWSRDQTRRSSLTQSQTSPSTRKINLAGDNEETSVLDLHGVYVAHPGLPVWIPQPGPRAQAQVRRRVADLSHHLPLPRVRLDFVNSPLNNRSSSMLSTSWTRDLTLLSMVLSSWLCLCSATELQMTPSSPYVSCAGLVTACHPESQGWLV